VSPPPRQPSNLPASVHARLGYARIPFQVDVGFGDIVVDPPARRELPTLLDLPAPELSVYPVEAVVAEKIEAMVRFDALNTRLKDYFDLYCVFRRMRTTDSERRGPPVPIDVGHLSRISR
jgi:predicted nucleotidyltransferase component of viral defense system